MTNVSTATFAIATLGCRVNQYESQAVSQSLQDMGLCACPFTAACDFYIINTCSVTAQSGRKSHQMIHQAHRKQPDAKILVMGCEAQRDGAALLSEDGVVYVCGNRNKTSVVTVIADLLQGNAPKEPLRLFDLDSPYEPMHITQSERTRAYVKIQDGCNGKCAYCIIASLRGPSCSRPIEDIVQEVELLSQNRYQEVVLTGIETSAYEYGLEALLERLDQISGIERIRLGSLDPAYLRPDRVARLASIRHLMPHFHLSLQSGCDATLQRMRRRYQCRHVSEAVESLRAHFPNLRLSADVIVGFPQESDAEFAQTFDFLSQLEICHLHLFPYSRRPGTEAAQMKGQIPKQVKTKRLSLLQELAKRSFANLAKRDIGTTIPVLFEHSKGGIAYGHTPHFVQVKVATSCNLQNEILPVCITGAEDELLIGTIE